MLSAPQYEIYKSNKQINLFLSGVGSGKTYLDGLISYNLVWANPTIRGFIGANTYEQLNTSTFFRIREVWKSIGIFEYSEKEKKGHYIVNKIPPEFWHINTSLTSYYNVCTFCNGCIIFLGSLDNAKAHEGKEFGWAILDETKDTKEDDVKDVILARLRQVGLKNSLGEDWNPLFISTAPAKVDWINKWFGLEDHIQEIYSCIYNKDDYFKIEQGNKFAVISSTYHNEDNLPANFIENKRTDWTAEKFKSLIYANPFTQTGGEYYSSFDRLKHIKRRRYNSEKALHISFDFNDVPYAPAALFQIYEVDGIYEVYCIDEIALKNPNNSTEEVCERIMANYGTHIMPQMTYGDATGRSSQKQGKEFRSRVNVLEKRLRFRDSTMRIPYSNPLNSARRNFMNAILEDKKPIRSYIDPGCTYMIDDFCYTKQDSITGLKDKHIVTDKDTGESYQKYGHFGDLTEYFLCEVFEKYMDTD